MLNNNQNSSIYIQLKDNTKEKFIRKSAITRITLGTFLTTTTCFVYAVIFSKVKKLDNTIIKNYLKGSSILSFSFFSLNEFIYSSTNFLGIYSNFFINYSIVSYILSKKYYKYLIRKEIMTWEKAIKFSHKSFLIFCVLINLLELYIYLYREIALYDGEDVFDFYKRKFIDKNDELITIEDIEKNLMAPIQIFNSIEKKKILDKYMIENYNDNDNNGKNRNLRSVNIYKFVKDTSI